MADPIVPSAPVPPAAPPAAAAPPAPVIVTDPPGAIAPPIASASASAPVASQSLPAPLFTVRELAEREGISPTRLAALLARHRLKLQSVITADEWAAAVNVTATARI